MFPSTPSWNREVMAGAQAAGLDHEADIVAKNERSIPKTQMHYKFMFSKAKYCISHNSLGRTVLTILTAVQHNRGLSSQSGGLVGMHL